MNTDSNVVCYNIYRRGVNQTDAPVSVPGAYLTKEAAESALVAKAEKYCIDKVGIENFTSGQIENPALSANIYNNFVLVRSGSEIEVLRRNKATFYGFTETAQCFFGILPVIQDADQEIEIQGQKKIITCQIDPIAVAKAIRQPQRKIVEKRPAAPSVSLMDKFQLELKEAVQRHSEKTLTKLLLEKPLPPIPEKEQNAVQEQVHQEQKDVQEEKIQEQDNQIQVSEVDLTQEVITQEDDDVPPLEEEEEKVSASITELEEKRELIYKIFVLESRGCPTSQAWTVHNSLEDLKEEYELMLQRTKDSFSSYQHCDYDEIPDLVDNYNNFQPQETELEELKFPRDGWDIQIDISQIEEEKMNSDDDQTL